MSEDQTPGLPVKSIGDFIEPLDILALQNALDGLGYRNIDDPFPLQAAPVLMEVLARWFDAHEWLFTGTESEVHAGETPHVQRDLRHWAQEIRDLLARQSNAG